MKTFNQIKGIALLLAILVSSNSFAQTNNCASSMPWFDYNVYVLPVNLL